MKSNYIAVAIIAFGVWVYREKLISFVSPMVIPPALAQTEACQNKKFCAIVYVAPWCPACKHYAPLLKQGLIQLKRPQEVGLKVIMGAERSPGDNAREAKLIGDKVIVDSDNSLGRDLKIAHFPTFIVVGEDQKVKLRDKEAFEWLVKEI